MKALIRIAPALLAPAMASAQSSADRVPAGFADIAVVAPGFTGGQLLVAIAAGVVLAFCFHWLLTNLTAIYRIWWVARYLRTHQPVPSAPGAPRSVPEPANR